MWVGSMPALTGLMRSQNFGFGAFFDKVLRGLGSISSLLSSQSPKAKNNDSLQGGNSTPTLSQDLLGQSRERYIELQDHHEHMREAWHNRRSGRR